MQSSVPEHDDTFDFLFKIILIGDTNVGKTCVVQNFKSGIFAEKQQNTIGVDFTVRTVDIEGRKVKFGSNLHGITVRRPLEQWQFDSAFKQVWQVSHMKDLLFRFLQPRQKESVEPNACAVITLEKIQVWDTAGQERFRTITQSYYRSAHGAMIAYDITRDSTFESVSHWIKEVELYGAANVVLVLIGNKCDLEQERQVPFQKACDLANERGILAALETSAKESQNVEEAFLMMARELMSRNGLHVQRGDPESGGAPGILLRENTRSVDLNVAAYKPAAPEKKSCC